MTSSTIGIIGLGYVGLLLSLQFARAGSTELEFDIVPARIQSLDHRESYVPNIQIDPFYLTNWKAREYGPKTRFVELVGEVNTAVPAYVIQRLDEALASLHLTIRDSRILMIGTAYKSNVDDDRESPAYVLWDLLEEQGAQVDCHDPHVPVIRPSREHAHLAGHQSVALAAGTLPDYDLVLVPTNQKAVDAALIAEHARLVVDSRYALSAQMKGKPNYFKA